MTTEIEYVKPKRFKIADLKEHPQNYNEHPPDQIVELMESLQQFGQTKNIVVWNGFIIAGHGLVAAAKQIGVTSIVAYDVSEWDETTAKRYMIADNETARAAKPDMARLAQLLADGTGDPSTVPGVSESLLRKMGMGGSALAADDPEAQYERARELIETWGVEAGRMWRIPSATGDGEHRLICGDCYDDRIRAQLMNGESADLGMHDPPYGINAPNMPLGDGKRNFVREDFDRVRIEIAPIVALTKQSIVWGGNYYVDALPVSRDWLCWYKKISGLSFGDFELAWSNIDCGARLFEHHWSGESKMHPTQKPLPVIVWAINLTDAGIVLDCFSGSGTTIIACEVLGRTARAIEISPAYVAVTLQRLFDMDLLPVAG